MTTYIQRLLETVDDHAANENRDFCILLESKCDPSRWVQLTWDLINAAYPSEEAPLPKVRESGVPLYPSCQVASWEPQLFATFERGSEGSHDQIAVFVAEYIRTILGVSPAENDIRIEEQQL